MTYSTPEELTFYCLSGAEPNVRWPVCMKRPGEKYAFGLLYKVGAHGFTMTPSDEKYALDFDSADAVVQAGWLID